MKKLISKFLCLRMGIKNKSTSAVHHSFCMTIVVLSIFLIGCVSVPHQSAELSGELGGMIRESRATHLALIDEYVNQLRGRVNDFMTRDWIPKFTKNFIVEAKLDQELAAAKNAEEKVQINQEFQEAAAQRISDRRALLMDAVDKIGQLLRSRINEHYDHMELVNQTLTTHLRSAEKVTATRDELLKLAKVHPNDMIPFEQLNEIVGKMEKFEGNVDALQGLTLRAKALIISGGQDGK